MVRIARTERLITAVVVVGYLHPSVLCRAGMMGNIRFRAFSIQDCVVVTATFILNTTGCRDAIVKGSRMLVHRMTDSVFKLLFRLTLCGRVHNILQLVAGKRIACVNLLVGANLLYHTTVLICNVHLCTSGHVSAILKQAGVAAAFYQWANVKTIPDVLVYVSMGTVPHLVVASAFEQTAAWIAGVVGSPDVFYLAVGSSAVAQCFIVSRALVVHDIEIHGTLATVASVLCTCVVHRYLGWLAAVLWSWGVHRLGTSCKIIMKGYE